MSISFIMLLSLIVTGFYYNQKMTSNPIVAAPLPGYTDIKTAPGINKVGATGSNAEINGDYGFMFKLTQYVTYVPIGNPIIDNGYTGSKTKVYRYSPDAVGEQGAWIKNAGLYNGRSVDLKFVVDKLEFKKKKDGTYPFFRFFAVEDSEKKSNSNLPGQGNTWNEFYLMAGSGVYSHEEDFTQGDKASYHYEFFDHETGKPLNLKGAWNFNNINIMKKASIPYTGSTFDSMYVRDISEIGYKLENGNFEMASGSYEMNHPEGRLTHLFSQQRYDIGMEFYGYGDIGAMGIMYSTESIARIAPATPIVYGLKNSAVHTDGEYKKIHYSILQSIADNTKENRNTTFELKTEVPSYYDIESIKVYEYGSTVDISTLFTIDTTGSNAVLTAKDSTSDAFNGKVFDIKITAKPNAAFKFDKKAYGYQVGGDDDGHMTFELGGPKTSVHYTYKTLFDKTLTSEVVENQSKAKVLYEGVPTGKSRENLTIPFRKSILDVYPDAGDVMQAGYELAVDTDNPLDQPVTATYKSPLPDTTVLNVGDQVNLVVILTSAKGVVTEVPVTLTVGSVAAEVNVLFVNDDSSPISLHNPIKLTSYGVGDVVDLTSIDSINKAIEKVISDGYVIKTRPTGENNFNVTNSEMTVTYIFSGQLILSSAPKVIDFGRLTYDAKTKRVDNPQYAEALEVKDTRGATTDGWYLTATLTEKMKNSEGKILENTLRYRSGQDDKILGDSAQIVFESQAKLPGTYKVSDSWGSTQNSEGVKLQLDGNVNVFSGDYTGTILWKVLPGQP